MYIPKILLSFILFVTVHTAQISSYPVINLQNVIRNNKCLLIASKQTKSFTDILYQNLHCKHVKLPILNNNKHNIAKQNNTKSIIVKPKIKKSFITKAKTRGKSSKKRVVSKPKTKLKNRKPIKPNNTKLKIPILKKPIIPKQKKSKAQPKKLRLQKRKKPTIPKVKKPVIPKLKKLSIPKFKKPTVPKVKKPKIQKQRKPTTSKQKKSKMSKLKKPTIPKLKKLTIPKLKKPTMPKLKKPMIAKKKRPNISKLKKPTIPKLKKPTMPKLKKLSIPKKKRPMIPKLKKPTIPKLKKPVIPKVKKPTIPRLKKQRKPKLRKPTIPKRKKPTTTKAKIPKPVPKVPRMTKPKKKPSLSPSPSRRPKKRSLSNRAKPKTKPSPRPSSTPSPSPRKPSPSPSLTKLKEALETTKKRLLKNIEKDKQAVKQGQSVKKICKTEEYPCGRKCTGKPGPRFLCHYPNQVPKFCVRKARKMEFCEGSSGATCMERVMEPDICTRNVSITEYCPDAEEGCKFNDVPFGRCLHDGCDRMREKKCEYDKRSIVTACKKPKTSCHDCKARFSIKACSKTVKERVTVPCPGESRLPSFEEELLGDGIESAFVRDVLCFESFFDESVCMNAPRVCRMFDDMFDRRLCAEVICQECSELMSMHVSEQVKEVCQNLLHGSCTAAGEFMKIPANKNVTEECYGTKVVEKMLPCYEQLPKGKICSKGCVMKACKKKIYEVKGYCERNLPNRCMKADEIGCRRETKRIRDCSSERICEYVVKKPYLCFKEKQVEVPCEGGCEVLKDERYVCGSEEEEVEAVCREQFDHSCRNVVCSREICR